jgi:hypothetical protein
MSMQNKQQQQQGNRSSSRVLQHLTSASSSTNTPPCCPAGTLKCGDYTYTGEWVDDEMHGQGKFSFASGACYEGCWQHNQYQGQGRYTFPDGRTYQVRQQMLECYIPCMYVDGSKRLRCLQQSCCCKSSRMSTCLAAAVIRVW